MQIMEGWKNQKFFVLTGMITDIAILLSDFKFWVDNADKLEQWCRENNCRQEGMLVIFPDKKTLSMFCLQWS
jgi:hypothetical protein